MLTNKEKAQDSKQQRKAKKKEKTQITFTVSPESGMLVAKVVNNTSHRGRWKARRVVVHYTPNGEQGELIKGRTLVKNTRSGGPKAPKHAI
ncbi:MULTISPECIES: hypothetical protein [unclassified Vibrio]|uniref:hypothetical protein n=1 Tax=unclassified Vibrio TaxID=2614977 RepID=UPI00159DEDC6|nr:MULTISPECIES: hypothetical protein [unclassified Vibrio]NVN82734.1 hypothetical protein [Vibrio sp. Scap16]QLE93265.1 hypothetical protein FLM53_09585 [Vibrio sp. Scap24]